MPNDYTTGATVGEAMHKAVFAPRQATANASRNHPRCMQIHQEMQRIVDGLKPVAREIAAQETALDTAQRSLRNQAIRGTLTTIIVVIGLATPHLRIARLAIAGIRALRAGQGLTNAQLGAIVTGASMLGLAANELAKVTREQDDMRRIRDKIKRLKARLEDAKAQLERLNAKFSENGCAAVLQA